MKIDAGVILTWVLFFLALFPMVFCLVTQSVPYIFLIKITPKLHLSVENHLRILKKWAPFTGIINLTAGLIAFWTIIGVVVLGYEYSKWSAMAGCTIWGKIFADWILRNQAHPFQFGKKKENSRSKLKS